LQLVWGHGVLLVCTVYSVLYSEIALSRKPFGIGHMYIYSSFLLRMTDTMIFRYIDLSSWDILYMKDVTTSSLIEFHWRFWAAYWLQLQDTNIREANTSSKSEELCSPLNFNQLHGVTTQKTAIFRVAAVKTSDPRSLMRFILHRCQYLRLCSV
jgi:hypothetical protein